MASRDWGRPSDTFGPVPRGSAVGLDDGQLLARYARSRDEVGVRGPGGPARADGPGHLPGRPPERARRRGRLPGHLPGPRPQGRLDPGRRRPGRLAAPGRPPGRVQASVEADGAPERRRRGPAPPDASVPARPATSAVLHEELDRLPERYRLPVVLCDLEGLTHEQAGARQLRWSEPTLRHRLAPARRRMRDRLIRRGITAGAVPAGSTSWVRATVPAALARSAVAAAVGDASPAAAAALTGFLLRSMLTTRLKFASAWLLAAIALAPAAFVPIGARRPDEGEAGVGATATARGTAADGPIPALDDPRRPDAGQARHLVHSTAGVIDLEGRPVPGAQVGLVGLWSAPGDDLAHWLDRARDRGVWPIPPRASRRGACPPTRPGRRVAGPSPLRRQQTTTGPDGRFHLAGVGPTQVAHVVITGPSIAASPYVYVPAAMGPRSCAAIHQGLKPARSSSTPGRLGASHRRRSRSRAWSATRTPAGPWPGSPSCAAVYEERNLVPAPGIEARTDERGQYRLDGLPRAPAYRLFVDPGGEPYAGATLRVAAGTPAFEPVTFDVGLGRGIPVRGRVTDRATGRPVRASVDVYAFEDNPHARDFPGFREGVPPRAFTAVDGRYEALAVPGRGLIGVQVGGYLVRYRVAVGIGSIRGIDPGFGGFRTIPTFCHPDAYNALAEIDLDPKAGSATLDLQVEPGRTVAVTPVDPEGRPVAGTTAAGVVDLHPTSEYPQESPTFEIHALDPSRPRRVTVAHAGRNLIGSVYLNGDEAGPLTIPLRPSGTIAGRIVDDDGRPRGGLGIISSGGSRPARPAEQGILPGGDVGGGIRVGRDGRFRIGGLVPGLKYGGGAGEGMHYHGELFRDVTVAPGEVKDLGDLKAVPPGGPTERGPFGPARSWSPLRPRPSRVAHTSPECPKEFTMARFGRVRAGRV